MLSEQLAPPSAIELDDSWKSAPDAAATGDENFRFVESYQSMRLQENAMTKQQITTVTTTTTTTIVTKKCVTHQQQQKSMITTATTATTSSLNKNEQKHRTEESNGQINGQMKSTLSSNDASGRSAALERAYVHDVYENCEESTGPLRPRVAQFLSNLDPGSVVCDVGCGNGRYLTQCNPSICTIGVDRCRRLSKIAHEKGGEVTLCDNLELPFRNDSFDAVLSLAVIHHFATTERRVSAIRELARILRVGGRVIITVWALEQRHRRFESQDVLIPWQPPKNRNINYSDEEDDDDFLPPYHAYTEDSTNSSRSAGDGDSSSLSSSSPGESCYSFVRRAILKLAGGRKHPWFLDSWTSKDTKNDSSLDYEDAKDLPIELRRLEDFEDFCDPPLSASLKSRSLGSILNPPPRQIVRSRSSVPILSGPMAEQQQQQQQLQLLTLDGIFTATKNGFDSVNGENSLDKESNTNNNSAAANRRPKLIKQKQSLCDEDFQLPDTTPFHMISSYSSSSNCVNNSIYVKSGCYGIGNGHYPHHQHHQHQHHNPHHISFPGTTCHNTKPKDARVLLRKQSSLNEELMAGNRIREKERIRKRIQKQMSLNETFLCRSVFTKRLQVIREGFTSKLKTSTGSLERVTKNGFVKILQNFKSQSFQDSGSNNSKCHDSNIGNSQSSGRMHNSQQQQHNYHHHHHHHYQHHQQHQQESNQSNHLNQTAAGLLFRQNSVPHKSTNTVTYCNDPDCGNVACYCSAYGGINSGNANIEDQTEKARRHSRGSGSDSSKDSSLQSDTSIESEDSFASVIFIPKPEQQQQQQQPPLQQQQRNYQKQYHNSNSSSSNSSGSNGTANPSNNSNKITCNGNIGNNGNGNNHCAYQCIPSVPTSPLIMPCPPTPAHSPAAAISIATSPPQTVAAVTAAMAILTPPLSQPSVNNDVTIKKFENECLPSNPEIVNKIKNHFSFDEEHIAKQQQTPSPNPTDDATKAASTFAKIPLTENAEFCATKITRQAIKDLPPIPKFRKQLSSVTPKNNFPIIRRCSSTSATSIAPNISKLLSLELFNPATDDLDSDSSEPSSPDSIDSVISAPKATTSVGSFNGKDEDITDQESTRAAEATTTTAGADLLIELDDIIKAKQQQQQQHKKDFKINIPTSDTIVVKDDTTTFLPYANHNGYAFKSNLQPQRQDCNDFAQQLNAQLLRELEDKKIECHSLDGIAGDIGEYIDDPSLANYKKRNGEIRDLTALREELRERRLMLANLSTQQSLQQSSTSSSTSSLSSQTRSLTIHEEDEEEEEGEENDIDPNSSSNSYSLNLYENIKISKFKYKRNRHYNLNPETAYLLQDDGDSSIRDDDDDDDIEHDVILEEDEDEIADAEELENDDNNDANINDNDNIKTKPNCIKFNANENDESPIEHKSTNRNGDDGDENRDHHQINADQNIQNRQSTTESWGHSNSSTSLDSPSQGGATTHHRYYHVFREGELDALINHHVASLHIVSSYYERACWCVVAEKVQVWTI